jgi:membrane fusion protein, multidrug efflux system
MTVSRICVIGCIILLTLAGCKEEGKKNAPPAPEVDVAAPLKHNIVDWDEYTGRFEAVQRVDIRARVTGYLVEKRFKDGQNVNKGDVLFIIDPRPFNYEMERANAQYQLAQKEYTRAKGLRETQAISQEDLDRREQELKVAQAALNDASLDVEFTKVTAPIDGKISESFIDTGNLVRENDTVLTRIVSVDPVHFVFEGSQTQLLKYLRLDRAGLRPGSEDAAHPVLIELQDEDQFTMHNGRMDFTDNIVDPQTGTIQFRALVENKDGFIYPGLFGRARITTSGEYEAILLPENTVSTDQSKKFVYVVSDDNKAQRAYVTVGPVLDNGFVVIRQGLKGNERVVINGLQRIRKPAQPVMPAQKTLEWVALNQTTDLNKIPSLHDIANKIANKTDTQKIKIASGPEALKS